MLVESVLSKREGLMLYWCEGDKTLDACMVSLTCAEPSMLCYFVDWLVDYYNVDRRKIRLRLHLWEGADEEEAVQFLVRCFENTKTGIS